MTFGCVLRKEKWVEGSREEATSEMIKMFQLGVLILWRLSRASLMCQIYNKCNLQFNYETDGY